jgi:Zn-dependent alcohol dehydrogenase
VWPLRLYDAGQLKLDELVTAKYRLEDVNQGYQDPRDGKTFEESLSTHTRAT